MMRAPFLIAQSRPLRMCSVVASGELAELGLKAWMASILASGATPMSRRCDRARHSGAMHIGLVIAADRVELLHDRAGEIGMPGVDRGIDHRDHHVRASGDAVDLGEPELAHDILRRIATRSRARQTL